MFAMHLSLKEKTGVDEKDTKEKLVVDEIDTREAERPFMLESA